MIDTSSWKEFRIGDLFEKLNLKCHKKFNKATDVSTEQTEEFDLPLVNAKHSNNGIMYYGRSEDWDSAEMTIDIVGDGAASTGDVYAQPQRTGVLYNAYLVKPLWDCTSEYVLQFMACVIEKCVKSHFGYENKCTWDKVSQESIWLPITSIGEPDWGYMESYMKAVMEESEKSLENLKKADDTKHLIDVSGWGEMCIGDYFEVEYGTFRPKDKLGFGKYNYVTTSGFNNGITDKIDVADHQGGCITVASDGALMGSAFYQEEPFSTSNIVSTLTPFDKTPLNKYNAQFICALIFSKRSEFGWLGFKFSVDRVRSLVVKVPITSTGEPDWQYMEDYMRRIMDKSEQIISDLQIGA